MVVAEDAVDGDDAFPRAAFALVFVPDEFAEFDPEFLWRVIDGFPIGVAALGGGEHGPFAAEEVCPIEAFAFVGDFLPFV